MMRDFFPELEKVCNILGTEQQGAVSWILEWIIKSLEGVELHPDADEKASTVVVSTHVSKFWKQN